jgi:outer membrane lipoprotein-sorting protein
MMSFVTRFACALVPAAVFVAPAAAQASAADMALVRAHLQQVESMTARFVQTDARGRSLSGTLQMQRPGRIRFEYGRGVDVLLVADGRRLTFIDYEVGQKSSWDLNRTPLGFLLSRNPDLDRLARIQQSDDPRVVVVRARGEYGTLVIAFLREASAPGGLRMHGWTAVDPQGKRTMVRLSDHRYNVAVPARAFTYTEPTKRAR